MNAFSVLLIVLYVMTLFIMSAFFLKRAIHSYSEYNFCGRSLTIGYIILTYMATWIGGGTIIGLAGVSYVNGINQYWLFGTSCLAGFLHAFFFITRIRALSVNSIGDMMAMRFPQYSQRIRIPVAAGLIARNVTAIGMQFTAMSYMLMYSLRIDMNLAVLATFIIITGYTSLSGLWGVVITDVLQGILQTAGLVILLCLTIHESGGVAEIVRYYHASGQETHLSLLGDFSLQGDALLYFLSFGVFFIMGDQSDWQRTHSGKTDKAAFWGYLIPLTITLLLLLIPALIGVFQKSFTGGVDTQPEYMIYYFLFEIAGHMFASIILIAIFSSIMSSADSYMIATGLIFSNDLVKRFLNRNAGDKELIFWTRIAVIISGAIGFAFAINIHNILYLWFTGIAIPTIILLPSYFCAWFSKRANTGGALVGAGSGVVFCGIILLADKLFSAQTILIGFIIVLLTTLFTSHCFDPPLKEEVMSTYYWSERFSHTSRIPK